MFDIVLSIFLALSPIFFLPVPIGNIAALQFYQFNFLGFSNAIIQTQFLQFGIIALFATALFCKPHRYVKDKYLGLLFALCVLSVFWHPKTVKVFPNVMLGFLLYYIVTMYAKNVKRLAYSILIVSSLNTLFAILQFFGVWLIYQPTGRIDGLMCISGHLGAYQALALPVCYWLNPWLTIIPLTGLLLSKCVTATIAAGIGMIILLRKKIVRNFSGGLWVMLGISLFTSLVIGSLTYAKYKLFIRLTAWNETITMIHDKLLFGHGIGTFKFNSSLGQFDNPYNLYLSIFYALGIGGLIFFCFIKDKFHSWPNTGISASCLIALIIGLGQSFMDFPRIAGTVIVLFALLTIEKGERYGNDNIAV